MPEQDKPLSPSALVHHDENTEYLQLRQQLDILGENYVMERAVEALQENPETTVEQMYRLASHLEQFPHLPVKTTVNLGRRKPTPIRLHDILENFEDKIRMEGEYYPDGSAAEAEYAREVVADFTRKAGLPIATVCHMNASGQLKEFNVTISRDEATDPHKKVPIFNTLTSHRLRAMADALEK